MTMPPAMPAVDDYADTPPLLFSMFIAMASGQRRAATLPSLLIFFFILFSYYLIFAAVTLDAVFALMIL